MTTLKDITDFLKKAAGKGNEAKKVIRKGASELNSLRGTSLAKLSSAATLQFPIIISRSVNVDTAQAVSKALERQYATFVEIVVSLDPNLNLDKDENIRGYLRKYHQNNVGLGDLLESCMNVYTDEALGIELFVSLNEGCNHQVLKSNKEQMFVVEDCLNMNSINNLYQPKSITMPIAESALDYYCKKNNIVTEANNDDDLRKKEYKYKQDRDVILDKRYETEEKNRLERQAIDDSRYADKIVYQHSRDQINDDFQERRIRSEENKLRHEIERDEAEFRSKAMVRLADNDVKKSNELVPTTLSLTLNQIKGEHSVGIQNFIIGVKGLMHPVDSNEMITNLLDGFKSGNAFFNFIRWTSGEIAFLKDFVLNISGIKDDVMKRHTNSRWWSTLKRRRQISKAKKNNLLPNASIVCTIEEITEINETYGINLLDVRHIKRIIDRYFLLGFVIVDESQELCHVIFDGENNYQVLTYRGLEKENNSKNDFKEIYKMINNGRI